MTMTSKPKAGEDWVGQGVAWADRTAGRVRLRVSGPDRARFLHNLTTQDVKALGPGQGAEAFVTNLQGRTLAYATILATEHDLIVRTDAASLDPVLAHFGKYGVFDDVSWTDETSRTFEWHLFGAGVRRVFTDLAMGEAPYATATATVEGQPVRLVRECIAGSEGRTLIGPIGSAGVLAEALERLDFVRAIEPGAFEALRIADQTPVSGIDVTPENLPQEVGRDAATISFHKGCYLGQETVARLDALGHVNKLLRGLEFGPGAEPRAGMPLVTANGKPAGTITSCAHSAARGGWVGLGYLRVAHEPGAMIRLETAEGAEVRVAGSSHERG